MAPRAAELLNLNHNTFPMSAKTDLLSRLAIVLVPPKFAENIGAAARIAWNMGITQIIVISDKSFDQEAMAKMATHKAAHLIEAIEVQDNLADALASFSVIVGTTARRGRNRFVHRSPRQMVEALLPELPNNRAAILFGPEDTGLTNEDLKHCHMASAIPTADFSSINLAQAVAIHCYEIYYGAVHMTKDMQYAPQYASSFELESMYNYLEKSLFTIDFLDNVSHIHWMSNIRQLLHRIRLTSKETNIIRGICKKFLEHQKNC